MHSLQLQLRHYTQLAASPDTDGRYRQAIIADGPVRGHGAVDGALLLVG